MPLRKSPHPRYKLKTFSKELRKLTFPTSPISIRLARWAADAFDAYLSGKAPTLDEAFGVRKARGRPRTLSAAKERYALAKRLYALRRKGKSWYEIEEEFGQDQRILRRVYEDFKVPLMARAIGRDVLRDLNRPTRTPRSKTL